MSQAEARNAEIGIRETEAQAMNDAATRDKLTQGIVDIGSNAASFRRDKKAYDAQDRAMFSYMNTSDFYYVPDEKGNPVKMSRKTNKPAK
jgi:hypothetical protein